MALRFARRTVSLRCPSSSRPINTRFVFLFLKWLCETRTTGRPCQYGFEGAGPCRTHCAGGSCPPRRSATGKVMQDREKADRCEIVAVASRTRSSLVVLLPTSDPLLHGVRGAPPGPGRRCRLHPAAEPPACRMDDRRGRGRQACPLREAARDDSGRCGTDDRGRRRRRRAPDGGVHVSPPSVVVAARGLVEAGRIGRLSAVQTGSYFNDDAANIRNIRAFGGGALFGTSGATR